MGSGGEEVDSPLTTRLVALASLALGIGLNILLFSFTASVLFEALPYPESDRLVEIGMPPGSPPVVSTDGTRAVFEAAGVFEMGRTANLAGDAEGPAERLSGHRISASAFAALGAEPMLGRLPTAADQQPGAPPAMLLSYALWQRRFSGRADVAGQTVTVDGQPTRILGVMPQGFWVLDAASDAWFPLVPDPTAAPPSLRGVARLKPGVSIEQARAAMSDDAVELVSLREARFGALLRPLTIVQLSVAAMLLVVCVNLGVALRASVAQRLRLALGGGAIGAVLAALALAPVRDLMPRLLPRLDDVTFDARVFAFAVAVTIAAGLLLVLFGRRPRAATGGVIVRSAWRARLGASALAVFVGLQLALAFVLLAGTGLAGRAFGDLKGRDVGIDTSGLLGLDVHLPRDPYVTRPGTGLLASARGPVPDAGSVELAEYNPAGAGLFDRVRAALEAMPGATRAAGAGTPPFAAAPFAQFWVDDQEHAPENLVGAQYLAVTEHYFDTMGIRVVRGRDLSPADRRDSPWVVLVNEAMAREHWPGADPVGRRLTFTFHPDDEEPSREVVGVVADTLPFRGASEVRPLIYILHRQQADRQRASFEGRRTTMSFIVRTPGDPLALADAARGVVGEVDSTVPVTSIRTVESYLDAGQVRLLQFAAVVLGLFALAALFAGAAGALGLNVFGAVAAAAIGTAAGFHVWQRLSGVIEPFLTNLTVAPSDALPLVASGAVLLVTALVASTGSRLPKTVC